MQLDLVNAAARLKSVFKHLVLMLPKIPADIIDRSAGIFI